MNALLLAAGLGTRLRPLTETVPKCLVPVRGRPLLAYWLELLASSGVDRIIVNLHHLPEIVTRFVETSPHRDRVVLVHEKTLLGTGGTVLAQRSLVEHGPFLVIHADNLSRFDLRAMLKRHQNRPTGCLATMMTFEADDPSTCGIVAVNDHGVVTSFVEKPERPASNLANGAVYVFEPEILNLLAGLGKKVIDLSTDILPLLVGHMCTFKNDLYHRDIGSPAALRQAQLDSAYLLSATLRCEANPEVPKT